MSRPEEKSDEFKSVFSAWKKRDSAGGSSNSDIVRIGSMGKVGSSFRSFKNASSKKFGDGAKKLTSVVDGGAKKLTSVVHDGAELLTDTTKKVTSNTVKLTTDGAKILTTGVTTGTKKLTSVVTGKSTNYNSSRKPHYQYEESEEIVFDPPPPPELAGLSHSESQNGTASPEPTFAPIINQSQEDVKAKIAARYRTQPTDDLKQTKPE